MEECGERVPRAVGASSAAVGGGQWHVSSTHPGGIVIDEFRSRSVVITDT